MLKRDFTYHGMSFYLNDAKYHNEFTPKYLLMYFHEGYGNWREICPVDTKKEAMELVRGLYREHLMPFS